VRYLKRDFTFTIKQAATQISATIKKTHLHVVIPRHNGDLAPKTIKSVIVQAEMTVEELVSLL